jgi:predicted ABC-type ATPase
VTKPFLVILAGPNGVGKTTFARANLVEFIRSDAFLNADDVAREMRPDDVAAVAVGAGRRLLDERQARLAAGQSFCIETTLATRTLLRFVKQAQDAGFRTRLIFLFTPYPQLNELRVKQRVMAGGHNVDTATIYRRHRKGLQSLAAYWDICDEAVLFDARTDKPRETLVKDGSGTRVTDRFGWMWLRGRLRALGARVLDVAE